MCSIDPESMPQPEEMNVHFSEVVGKPSVRHESGGRIVVSNMPKPPFPISGEGTSLPKCSLRDLVRDMKRLGQDGDRKGREAYEKKRKKRQQIENRNYRVPLAYLTKVTRVVNDEEYELTVRFVRNTVIPAQCRHDPKGCFRKMTDDEVEKFLHLFTARCAFELQQAFDKEYEMARGMNVEPDYYNFHRQDKHVNA